MQEILSLIPKSIKKAYTQAMIKGLKIKSKSEARNSDFDAPNQSVNTSFTKTGKSDSNPQGGCDRLPQKPPTYIMGNEIFTNRPQTGGFSTAGF